MNDKIVGYINIHIPCLHWYSAKGKATSSIMFITDWTINNIPLKFKAKIGLDNLHHLYTYIRGFITNLNLSVQNTWVDGYDLIDSGIHFKSVDIIGMDITLRLHGVAIP